MNNALFAIPGLMPPRSPNYKSKLVSPEDGSLCLCVHCGRTGDEVNYAVRTSGWLTGVIKDPSYNYECNCDGCDVLGDYTRRHYPQFLTISDSLPDEAIVPVRVVRDWPIPITERPDIPTGKLYWILKLPIRTLPMGDSEVQVVINGALRKYFVQRPTFDIHRSDDITTRYEKFIHQEGEVLDVSFTENTPSTLILDLIDCCDNPETFDGALYRATAKFCNGKTVEFPAHGEGSKVIINVPGGLTPSLGLYNVEYKIFDDWLHLTAGDIVITAQQ